jgi:hypothetical protein
MWNMPKEGFKELYERIPGPKPSLEDIWRLTGGDSDTLRRLYQGSWRVEPVIERIIEVEKLDEFASSLNSDERTWLCEAIEDPDTLYSRERIPLFHKLVELDLVVDEIPRRDPLFRINEPPPEKGHELGIGRLAAWQTPLHREAVMRVLKSCKTGSL